MTPSNPTSKRRFIQTLGLAAGAQALPVWAQSTAPAEGVEFRAVRPAQPTDSPGKIEVLEFFWYGCPHCNAFEPSLRDWVKRLPADVAFRKVHVGLNPSWLGHQQMYFALEVLGRSAELNERVFAALHVDRIPLDRPERMADFVARHGVDRKQFLEAFDSFAVRTRSRRATQLAEAYGVDGVPTLAVQGKWVTSPGQAGGNAQVLRVLDFLIDRERHGGR